MPATDIEARIRTLLAERRVRLDAALASIDADPDSVVRLLQAIEATVRRGGTILTCGNGGSAAEALHLAEELIGRYRGDRPPIRSMCLNADPTALTCIANDFGFEAIFARQVEAMATDLDALVIFSTSGRSPNLLAALEAARARNATTIGFLGGDGGEARALCDVSVVVGGRDSAAIQEVHQFLMHACCEQFETDSNT
ncbi:MAG: SIS domain-containing protein [Phycisphaerales bacterium]|nr:SIS domain-containing protein [Phycisphaerales bacterium]